MRADSGGRRQRYLRRRRAPTCTGLILALTTPPPGSLADRFEGHTAPTGSSICARLVASGLHRYTDQALVHTLKRRVIWHIPPPPAAFLTGNWRVGMGHSSGRQRQVGELISSPAARGAADSVRTGNSRCRLAADTQTFRSSAAARRPTSLATATSPKARGLPFTGTVESGRSVSGNVEHARSNSPPHR